MKQVYNLKQAIWGQKVKDKTKSYTICHVQVRFQTKEFITFSRKVYDQQEIEMESLEQKSRIVEQDIPRAFILALDREGHSNAYCVSFVWPFDRDAELKKDFVNPYGDYS